MSELIESLEKSVEFLRGRYPDGNPLLTCLETQLDSLKEEKAKNPDQAFTPEVPAGASCCQELKDCSFFEALQHVGTLADRLQEYVTAYCCGPDTEKCYRLKYLKKHGQAADEMISPAGDDYSKYL